MHLVLMTRGINQQFELWKKFMETHMFWWKRQPLLKDEKGEYLKNEDGTYKRGADELTKVQGALRPIQLFEYVFPKECLGEVLAMLNKHKEGELKLRPEVNTPAWVLRKLMKLKPIPVIPEIQNKEKWQITDKYTPSETMGIYLIGIKDDPIQDYIFGKEGGWYQEGL